MYSDLLENRVILLKLESFRGILLALGGDVTGGSRHTTGFVLGAFHDDLYPGFFCLLRHFSLTFGSAKIAHSLETNKYVEKILMNTSGKPTNIGLK